MERTVLSIEGMSCHHCVGAVERALGSVEGLRVQKVEIGSAQVAFEPGRVQADVVRGAIEAEGFTARDLGDLR
jgi:copper chaperone